MAGTQDLVRFVVGLELKSVPEDVKDVAKRGILDCLGCCLVGVESEAASILLEEIWDLGESPRQATILGSGLRVPATTAALVNGTMGHANDYDDVQRQMQGHPSTAVLPAVLALGESRGFSGRELLLSYIAGIEANVALGRIMNPKHYSRGWHATSTVGTLGATLAAAKMLGLSESQASVALGIASSVACGLQANFGTMTKPLHGGKAAWNGVFAATMAMRGWTANPGFLDNKQGYARAFESELPPSALTGVVGDQWMTRTLQFKKYPSAAETHPPIEAALALQRKHRLDPESIEAVECAINTLTEQVCPYSRPTSPLEGKFSVTFCVAQALLKGEVGMAAFTEDGLRDKAFQRLLAKTTTQCAFKEVFAGFGPAEVRVRFKDGTEVSERFEGDQDGPLSWDDVIAKFRDCATGIIGGAAVEQVISAVRDLEAVKEVREFGGLMLGNARKHA